MEAKTIHRLLEVKPPDGYQRGADNPLKGDVLILDECSMIDIILFYNLLKAVPDSMTLIFIGDIDQLPSVGAGNVLRDLIDSEKFPVVRLNKIFRQAQESRIVMNAHRINAGKLPDLSNGKNTDFFFLERDNPEDAVKTILDLAQIRLPRAWKIPPGDIQILTPTRRGIAGASKLNQALQSALNPASRDFYQDFPGDSSRNISSDFPGDSSRNISRDFYQDLSQNLSQNLSGADSLKRGGYIFRTRDKVMQIRNNYEKEVFNGDIGVIASVDSEDHNLTVNFDGRYIEYDISELDELTLAYATTIHKSQGSEYPVVIMPVLMSHFIMLQRNLIYTGITRAKKALIIVGAKKALSFAIRNVTVDKRNTMLKERLRELL